MPAHLWNWSGTQTCVNRSCLDAIEIQYIACCCCCLKLFISFCVLVVFFFSLRFFRLNEPILFGGKKNGGDYTHRHTHILSKLSNSFGWELFAINSLHEKTNERIKRETVCDRRFFFLLCVFFMWNACQTCNLSSFFSFFNTSEHACTLHKLGCGRLTTKQQNISIKYIYTHRYQWNASLLIHIGESSCRKEPAKKRKSKSYTTFTARINDFIEWNREERAVSIAD